MISVPKLIQWFRWLVYGLFFLTPLFILKTGVYPQVHPKMAFFQAVVSVMFALWLAIVFYAPEYRPKKNSLLIALIVFGAALLITTFTGVDAWKSFWSTQARSFGVFTYLHGLLLVGMLASLRQHLSWSKLIFASLLSGSLVVAIAIIQFWIPDILFPQEGNVGGRPGSTFGNPTYMAGYLILNFFLGLWLWLKKKDSVILKQEILVSVYQAWVPYLTGLQLVGIVLSGTRGSFAGVILGLMFAGAVLSWQLKQKNIRKTIASFFAVLVIFGAVFGVTREASVWSSVPLLNRFQDISLDSPTLLPRVVALQVGVKAFQERPILGWGWENFNVPFNENYDPRLLGVSYFETRFDKPHNAFLEYFVVGGVVLGLTYLAILFLAFKSIFTISKKENDPWSLALLGGGLVAYMGHIFFVFETLSTLILLVLFLGILEGYNQELLGEDRSQEKQPKFRPVPASAVYVLIGVSLVGSYFVNFLPVLAARYQALGFVYESVDAQESLKYFEKARSIKQPYQWGVARDYAIVIADRYFYNPDLVPVEVVRGAVEVMESIKDQHPTDAYHHYVLVDIYNQVSDVDSSYLEKAEVEAAEALRLSPNRQQVLFSLSKTKSLQGDNEGALEILRQAIDLNPEVPDAHFFYGLISYVAGKPEQGHESLMKAIELGRRFKNANEYVVVGNLFADSGFIEDAIRVYAMGREAHGEDLELIAKLGVAYFVTGNFEESKKQFDELVQWVDVRQTPGFDDILPILERLQVEY